MTDFISTVVISQRLSKTRQFSSKTRRRQKLWLKSQPLTDAQNNKNHNTFPEIIQLIITLHND